MAKKRKAITPGHYFVIVIACTIVLMVILVPNSGTMVNTPIRADTVFNEVPTVFIREDTCETLLKNFCEKLGGVKYSSRSLGKQYEVQIYNFGANKGYFYNNNKDLLTVTDKGFTIETKGDTLKATFVRKIIRGYACVELPSDVLFALMAQHPLIR